MRRLVLCFLVLSLSAVSAANSQSNAPLSARLDSLMQDAVTRYRLAGVSVAVVRGHDTLINRGYGYAELSLQVPATAATRYRVLGPHLAAAVMLQVERGAVRLDQDVTPLLPDFPWQGKHVTLRQLMDATSGLPDFHYLGDAEAKAIAMSKAPDEVTALFAGLPFTHEPGASWQWTISGFHLAGDLVERLSGKTYGEYLQENVFAPARLQATHYCGDRTIVPNLARPYSSAFDGMRHAPTESATSYPYIGTVCATAADAVSIMRALRDGRLLKPESFRALSSAEGPAKNAGAGVARGVGLRISAEEGHRWIGETGMLLGYGTTLMDFPEDSLTIALLTNTVVPLVSTGRNLARVVLGLPLISVPAPTRPTPATQLTPVSAAERKKYIGTFMTQRVNPPPQHRNFKRTYRVFERHQRLMLQALGEEPEVLLHQEGERFRVRGGQVTFSFEAGRVAGIEINFASVTLRGPLIANR